MTTVLRAALLLTGRDPEPVRDGAVAIDDDRIVAVGPASSLTLPAGARMIDLGEGTLLPGLIDLHSHATYYFRRSDMVEFGGQPPSDAMITLFATWQLQKALRAGVTTVRDTGAVNRLVHEIEKARAKGFVRVPRICACGRLITPSGGHVHDRRGLSHQADGVEGVRRAVREEIRAGAAFIKLATNGADFSCPEARALAAQIGQMPNGVEFSQAELDVAVEEAHRAGLRVACHTRWRPSVLKAIRAGVDTIEHGTYMSDEDMMAIAERGIVWVPTIFQGVAFARLQQGRGGQEAAGGAATDLQDICLGDESLQRKAHLFELALRLGVRIGCGTDIFRPEVEFAAVVDELEVFVALGMAPAQAIEAATRVSAEAIGWDHCLGTLEPGKLADLIFVEGNLLADLAVLRHPRLVVQGGTVVVGSL